MEDNKTISTTKEESIKKTIEILQQIERPQIDTKKIINRMILICIISIFNIIAGIIFYFKLSNLLLTILSIIILVLLNIITIKKTIINIILLYQKYAPEEIRAACLFTPSCSEYMILAIKKYGIIIGIYKGIKRLLRCHSPNGGFDYP